MSMTQARRASAEEARAALARAGRSIADLARATDRSHGYWSKRLAGAVPLDVDDLAAIERETGVRRSVLVGDAA